MKQLGHVTILFLVILTFSCNKKSETNTKEKSTTDTEVIIPDSIRNFQYKKSKTWIVIKTTNQKRVAELIELENYEHSNWEKGLKLAHWGINYAYISPIVNDEFVFIVGRRWPFAPNFRRLKNLLTKLSAEFGEVNYYYTYYSKFTTLNYDDYVSSCVAKYKNGKLVRHIYYLSEDRSFTEEGEKTKAEEKIGLKGKILDYKYDANFTYLYHKKPKEFERKIKDKLYYVNSYDDSADKVFVSYYKPWVNSNFVYEIANEWDISPLTINNGTNYSKGLGLLGKLPERYHE
ncbi:hypothetical protein [Kordia sp.]|uniref:hypothetical protein n=1 Tax=Kordia sp. TaxID=1965332 RepID=UPI003B5CC28F